MQKGTVSLFLVKQSQHIEVLFYFTEKNFLILNF